MAPACGSRRRAGRHPPSRRSPRTMAASAGAGASPARRPSPRAVHAMTSAALTPTIRQGSARRAWVHGHQRGARGRSRCRSRTRPAHHPFGRPSTLPPSAGASTGHLTPEARTLILVVTLTPTLSLGGCGGLHPAHAPLPSLPSAAGYLQAIPHDPTIRSRGVGDTTLLRAGRSACQLAKSFNPDQAAYAALLLTVESSPHVSPVDARRNVGRLRWSKTRPRVRVCHCAAFSARAEGSVSMPVSRSR